MAKHEGAHERSTNTLALTDSEFLQLTSLIERVSASQLRGILVSRLSLKHLLAIGSAVLACVGLVFGAGYGVASFVSEVKDNGTEYKVVAKDSELKAKEFELKAQTTSLQAMQTSRDKLTETVSHLSRERDEAVSSRTRMAKLLGFYHLLSTCQKAEETPRQQQVGAELLQAHTKQLLTEKLATPDTKDGKVVGVYLGGFGDVLVSTPLGDWGDVDHLPIDHPARTKSAYPLPTHCWFPEGE